MSVKEILEAIREFSPEEWAQVCALLDTPPGSWVKPSGVRYPAARATRQSR